MGTLNRVACVIGLCLISGLLQAAEPVVCVTEEGATYLRSTVSVTRLLSSRKTSPAMQDYTEQRCQGDTDCLNRIHSREQAISAKFTRFINN